MASSSSDDSTFELRQQGAWYVQQSWQVLLKSYDQFATLVRWHDARWGGALGIAHLDGELAKAHGHHFHLAEQLKKTRHSHVHLQYELADFMQKYEKLVDENKELREANEVADLMEKCEKVVDENSKLREANEVLKEENRKLLEEVTASSLDATDESFSAYGVP